MRSRPPRCGVCRTASGQTAGRRTYVLRQRFSYTYDAPVRDLDHRLVVVPPRRHGDQRRRRHSITVSAADARTTHRRDAAGNVVTRSRVPLVPDRVEFVVDAVVERVGPGTDVLLPAAALTDLTAAAPDPADRRRRGDPAAGGDDGRPGQASHRRSVLRVRA